MIAKLNEDAYSESTSCTSSYTESSTTMDSTK